MFDSVLWAQVASYARAMMQLNSMDDELEAKLAVPAQATHRTGRATICLVNLWSGGEPGGNSIH